MCDRLEPWEQLRIFASYRRARSFDRTLFSPNIFSYCIMSRDVKIYRPIMPETSSEEQHISLHDSHCLLLWFLFVFQSERIDRRSCMVNDARHWLSRAGWCRAPRRAFSTDEWLNDDVISGPIYSVTLFEKASECDIDDQDEWWVHAS